MLSKYDGLKPSLATNLWPNDSYGKKDPVNMTKICHKVDMSVLVIY